MKQINLRVDQDFLERIDHARERTPRERWIRHLIEDRLEEDEARPSTETLSTPPVSPGITDERTGRVKLPGDKSTLAAVTGQNHPFQGLGVRCGRCGVKRAEHP